MTIHEATEYLGHADDDYTYDPYADAKVCECGKPRPIEDVMCARCVEAERQMEMADEVEVQNDYTKPLDPIRSVVTLLDPSIVEYAMGDKRGGYFLRGKKIETNIYPTLTKKASTEISFCPLMWQLPRLMRGRIRLNPAGAVIVLCLGSGKTRAPDKTLQCCQGFPNIVIRLFYDAREIWRGRRGSNLMLPNTC